MTATNPRDTVNFSEILFHATTFLRNTAETGGIDFLQQYNSYANPRSTQLGMSAGIAANRTARLGQANDMLLGRIIDSNTSTVTIQDRGYMEFTYDSTDATTPPVIGRGVVCDAKGGVKIAAEGKEHFERGIVVEKNTTTHTVIVLL